MTSVVVSLGSKHREYSPEHEVARKSERAAPAGGHHGGAQESSVDPEAFLVHTQINVYTPEEVLFWYLPAAAAAKIRSCRSSSSSARQGKRDKYS